MHSLPVRYPGQLPFVVDRMTYQGHVQGTLDSAQNALLGCQAGAIDAQSSQLKLEDPLGG